MTSPQDPIERKEGCVFCDREKIASPILLESGKCLVFAPLNPVVDGHLLVVPKNHVSDFTEDPETFLEAAMVASIFAGENGGAYNLITSKGAEASQSVFHLHIHLIPRRANDGLLLPWPQTSTP